MSSVVQIGKLFFPLEIEDIGKATVFYRKDMSPISITIEKSIAVHGMVDFIAYRGGLGEKLGKIKVDWLRNLGNQKYGSDYVVDQSMCSYGTGEDHSGKPKIFVESLLSIKNKKYKGIGTALMQAAMEYGYLKGCEGRIILDAASGSHGFYCKLGLLSLDEELNKEIMEQAQGKGSLGYSRETSMYLPDEAIAGWKKRIQDQPVFERVLEYLDRQPIYSYENV